MDRQQERDFWSELLGLLEDEYLNSDIADEDFDQTVAQIVFHMGEHA